MKLKATVGFVHPSRYDKIGILECDINLLADERFRNNNFEKQSYALKLMDAEIHAAVQRVNDRLKSEGLERGNFIYTNPKQASRTDEHGNITSL